MLKDSNSRFKCIYSDINVHVHRYLSRRLPLKSFMIASMGATLLHTVMHVNQIAFTQYI